MCTRTVQHFAIKVYRTPPAVHSSTAS